MKKLLAIMLALVITLALAVTCFAEAVTASGGSATGNVKVTYQPTVIYGVDVAFGSMDFTYYGTGDWIADGNSLTVTNHTNAKVNVALTYTASADFNGITGSFGDNASFQLESAVNKDVAAADSKEATLTLNGELAPDVTATTSIGKVVVAISVVR